MSTHDERIIALSKVKIALLIVGACVFVAIGIWIAMLDMAAIQGDSWLRAHFSDSPMLVHGFGIGCAVFFAASGLFGIFKLFDSKPGLVLNASGFVDNASGVAAGFVAWSEVTDVDIFQVARQKMLIVKVRDPERYIHRGNAIKQALNRANYNLCGSPIAIASNALKIDFDELSALFNAYWSQHDKAPT